MDIVTRVLNRYHCHTCRTALHAVFLVLPAVKRIKTYNFLYLLHCVCVNVTYRALTFLEELPVLTIHVYFSQPFRIHRYILSPYTSIRFNDVMGKEEKHSQFKPAWFAHSSVSFSTTTRLKPFFFFCLIPIYNLILIFQLIGIDHVHKQFYCEFPLPSLNWRSSPSQT